MPDFYYTYGTNPQYPYQNGWTRITAPDKHVADRIFLKEHPPITHSGSTTILTCAFDYTEEEFSHTIMFKNKSNCGEGEHEHFNAKDYLTLVPYKNQVFARGNLKRKCGGIVYFSSKFSQVAKGLVDNIDTVNQTVHITNVDHFARLLGLPDNNITIPFCDLTLYFPAYTFDSEERINQQDTTSMDYPGLFADVAMIAQYPSLMVSDEDRGIIAEITRTNPDCAQAWQENFSPANSSRISKDQYYLTIAEAVSKRSTCLRRQYGAILVAPDNRIISTGYNGSAAGEPNCCDIGACIRMHKNIPHGANYELCVAIHAEDNAITAAGREAKGTTLYLAGFENNSPIANATPCMMCARKIKNAGIAKIVTWETLKQRKDK